MLKEFSWPYRALDCIWNYIKNVLSLPFFQVSLCKTMANVQRIFVFVLFWFGFASSMKTIVCIYNFVTIAFFYIGVQLFPKLMIIKIVLIRIYIKKVFFIRYRYNYIYTTYIYIYIYIYANCNHHRFSS